MAGLFDYLGNLFNTTTTTPLTPGGAGATNTGLLGNLSSPVGLLGAAILAGSGAPRSAANAIGGGVLTANDMAQQQQMRQLQMQQEQIALDNMRRTGQILGGAYGSPSQAPQQAPQPMPAQGSAPAPPPLLAANGPSPGLSAAAPQAPQDPFAGYGMKDNLPPQPVIDQLSTIPGNGALVKQLSETRSLALSRAQNDARPFLAKLDQAAKSGDPTPLVIADPDLKAVVQYYAPKLGIPLTDADSLRQVLNGARNQLASRVELPFEAPPVRPKLAADNTGRIVATDPITGLPKIAVAGEEPKAVIGADGKGVYVPADQAIGRQPWNQWASGSDADIQSAAKAIANYQMAPPTGRAALMPQNLQLMNVVRQINPQYDATQYTAKNAGYTKFTSGKQGDTVRSLSVATSHLDTLGQLVDALDNKDTRLLNVIGNKWAQETGSPAPTNFDTAKNIVADEVTKAIIGYGGSSGDREKAAAVIDRANSPAQLKQAIATYKTLMGGQLGGLRRQYEKATGRNDFDTMLSPEAQQQLEGTSQQSVSGIPSSADISAELARRGHT